jgi:esterase/lipase
MKWYVIALFAFVNTAIVPSASAYDYPFDNALEATVIGTPQKFRAELPKKTNRKDRRITIFPDREFTTDVIVKRQLHYSIVQQKKAAPLIFSIAGTGAGHNTGKMKFLESAFSHAGFHVVSLSSPTYSNFITTASSTQVPGHLVHDSEDLYRVMEAIYEQIKGSVDVTEFYITGYSLGGAQAAFVAKLDEEKKSFNFKKVLMINPPVNLFNSVTILDQMLEDNIPGGMDHFNDFFNELMSDFSNLYVEDETIKFDSDFLYRIYQSQKGKIDHSRLSATIGLSFRLSSSSMIFTSDVVTNSGYIVPKNHILRRTESTTDYFKVANRLGFNDYFYDLFLPYFSDLKEGVTDDSLMYDTSLNSIVDYLSTSDKIAVVHNEDDIILAPGEIDFFRDTFKSRAHIYPTGGHCGNLAYKENVDYMINYFKN